MKLQILADGKIVNYGQEPWYNQNDYPNSTIVEIENYFPIDEEKDNYWIDGQLVSEDKPYVAPKPTVEDQLSHLRDVINTLADMIESF